MRFRPVAPFGADLDRVLALTSVEPVWSLPADRYRAEAAAGQYRSEWTWIAEDDGGRVLARALWWGQRDSTFPLALDCLLTADEVPAAERAALAAALLDAGHAAIQAPHPPLYNLMGLPRSWRTDPAVAAGVAWRREAAHRAGLTSEVERLQYEWTPAAGLPAAPSRLVFTPEPDDETFLAAMVRVAESTLDAQTQESHAAHGPVTAAREALAFYRDRPGERDWWRLAHTADGALAGLAIPSATPYHRNIGYLGVVPELRGRGHVSEILSYLTRFHAAAGADRVTATTDLGNHPMAAAFDRCGYHTTEVRLIFSAPPSA
ncbi:GNAT family N-acetyltransferase [Dactylosporangium aurantiacum]|uniref:GNAT family N-acetyltransferase n=1 Tax=Dactylosporangium aurantiacum TaxID=35754 RepID=A0A9Q9IEZ8_9ACTN|nr:GNAT family N-acetyltransferase [Dactylosporangium aurantiacum]MDG6107373.1 GNAT family N-acetyltransferase [Dactylosporangium aurantiacum]UWZ54496.1 GNAT family N-acetyltransferase [Dactylosporangium aurantiacum]